SLVSYEMLLDHAHWMYVGAIGALLAVFFAGERYLGAKRWIRIHGSLHFQPSEWVKIILILALAKYFQEQRRGDATFADIAKVGLIVLLPFLMVLKQPDMGTALTYLPIAAMALALGGMRM